MKFRIGDEVVIISGKDLGKKGTITQILKKTDRVLVEGVNKRVKHVKKREGNAGERVEFFAPIHVSNVAIIDPSNKKPSRIGFKFADGKKIRISKSSGKDLPVNVSQSKVAVKA